MNLLVVAVLVVASVSDPGGTSCCHSVPDCTSHLFGHWCRSCQCRSCRSPLLLLFLLVDCCSIPCLFLCCCILCLCHILVVLVSFAYSCVAVPFSFAISLLSLYPLHFPLLLYPFPLPYPSCPGVLTCARSRGIVCRSVPRVSEKIAHTTTLPVPQAAQITFLQPNNTKVLNR